MSSCENPLSRTDLYLDGELRGEELEDFKRRLKECPFLVVVAQEPGAALKQLG